MSKVLVVDDDAHIRELLRVCLQAEGFSVHEAADGVEALHRLEAVRADIVVLDVMMPNLDGWELCRQLRQAGDTPVLMLTAKGETGQKLKGFRLGADDYLVKPFEPAELVARVRALLRRYHIASSRVVRLGELVMDRGAYTATVDGTDVTLPPKEFELLFELASYPNRTLSRDRLIESIWGRDYEGNERTLDVHINRLRERFAEGRHSFRIATVRGIGYRMEARQ